MSPTLGKGGGASYGSRTSYDGGRAALRAVAADSVLGGRPGGGANAHAREAQGGPPGDGAHHAIPGLCAPLDQWDGRSQYSTRSHARVARGGRRGDGPVQTLVGG